MPALLSIIVPVYNVEKYLERCIESIVHQTYERLEIILVDDGSSDQCPQICDEWSKKDGRIRVIHKQNGGISDARNAGLSIASGEYIAFVDSDDYIEADMYRVLVDSLERNRADITCAGILFEKEDGSRQRICRCPSKELQLDGDTAIHYALHRRIVGTAVWGKLYRREVWADLRFPPGETNEDVAVLVQLLHNKKLVHTAKPMYHYVSRVGSVTHSFNEHSARCMWTNACRIQQQISECCPQLEESARYHMAMTLYEINLSFAASRAKSSKQKTVYFKQFKKYWLVLMKDPGLSRTEKIKCLLLRLHLFRPFHRIKKKMEQWRK